MEGDTMKIAVTAQGREMISPVEVGTHILLNSARVMELNKS
jgi:hypothetical protein